MTGGYVNGPIRASQHVNEVEVIQVVQVRSAEGRGTEDDPCRWVTSFWTLDGKFLAEIDPGRLL